MLTLKHIQLRIDEVRPNEYLIFLPHRNYATMQLFDFLDAQLRRNRTARAMSLEDEGYITLQAKSRNTAENVAMLAGHYLLEQILKGDANDTNRNTTG
jgi:hypothetical protein